MQSGSLRNWRLCELVVSAPCDQGSRVCASRDACGDPDACTWGAKKPLAGAGRALLTSDVVKLRGVRNRARDGACCDDTCCDARGVMHEYIMAIFLGKSENQEGGGCAHC